MYWEPIEQHRLRIEFEKKQQQRLASFMFGTFKKSPPAEDENVKLAWVMISGERKMLGVDNKTMAGYKMRSDVPAWEMPLVPQQYDKFERWCTSFDV
jgi:hypothetical protein